ncbi:MAG: arginine deiminase family protein, partial [Oscillospiraceae bacterium]
MADIQIFSEIGKLKKVMLHRPGYEFNALTPSMLERLSYDDMPQVEGARVEHDKFADLLRSRDVEVVYLEDLVSEALNTSSAAKASFIEQFVDESGITSPVFQEMSKEFLTSIEKTEDLVAQTMCGITIDDLPLSNAEKQVSLADKVFGEHRIIADAIVCPLFTRDPFSFIGNGVALNKMYNFTRSRETIYGEYIFKYHKDYKDIDMYATRYANAHLEGGDTLVLSKDVLAIGISLRTEPDAIELLAKNLFAKSNFKTVLAFKIPTSWSFMHLDTVFTMVDYDKFTIHPEIMGPLQVFALEKADNEDGFIVKEQVDKIEHILEKYLHLDKV